MEKYNNYIKGLRDQGTEGDFDRLRAGVEARVRQGRTRSRLAMAGTLVVFIMAAAASYVYLPSIVGGDGDVLLSYVFEPEGSLDGPVLDYVLSE